MTINHNIFFEKSFDLNNEMPWYFSMVRSLPELLIALLDMKNPQSLERLQLVSIDISLDHAHENGDTKFSNAKLSHSLDVDDLLLLSGDLMAADKKILSLTIGYFLRGQRQFFRARPPEIATTTSVFFPAIHSADIEKFLQMTGDGCLPNSLFVDDKLIHLYGSSQCIPSQMMLWLILHSIFSLSSSRYKNFCAKFFSAAPLCALKLSYCQNLNNFFVTFSDDKSILMSMSAVA